MLDNTPIPGDSTSAVKSSEEGFTQFRESAVNATQTVMDALDRPIASAYNVQTPSQMLTRVYMVGQYTWTNVWAGVGLSFPGVLLGQPTIQAAILRSKYFRANVKVEIKLNTTQYHQGALLVAWVPCLKDTVALDTRTLSGCNAIVLSAGTQDSCTLTLPYQAPADWMASTIAVNATTDSRIARLFIRPINALTATSANIPLTVPVTVFASFTDIMIGGYCSQANFTLPEEDAHSATGHNAEAEAKNKQGIDAKGAVSFGSKLLRKAPVVGPAYGMLADFINSVAGDLAKPLSQAADQPIVSTYSSSAALTHGLTVADQLTMYPDGKIVQSKIMGGMQTSHMTVSEMAQKPMLYRVDTLDSVTTYIEFRAVPFDVGNLSSATGISCDWLYYCAYAFRRWRGSIKYKVHVCVPAFYSFRLRITLIDQNGIAITDYGDLPARIVDVKGDTWVDFMVPYFRPYTWSNPRLETPSSNNFPKVRIELITPIVGSSAPSTPKVYLNTWRAGGEDTAFSGLLGARDGTITEQDAHCSINNEFAKPFQGIIDGFQQSAENGFVVSEIAGTISDCVKRPASHIPIFSTNPTTSTFPVKCSGGVANANWGTVLREPFHYFSAPFLFWRGGRVLKRYQTSAKIALSGQGALSLASEGDGLTRWFASASDALLKYKESVQIPWISNVPWYPVDVANVPLHATCYKDSDASQQVYAPIELQGFAALSGPDDYDTFSLQGADDYMLLAPYPFFVLTYMYVATSSSVVNREQTPTLPPELRGRSAAVANRHKQQLETS